MLLFLGAVAQNTVGPYEEVQLKSSDPNAVRTWLTDHGYNVPVDIQPVIDAYVNNAFDFIALKLVPGKGVNAMRPVRVITPGASPMLPLRMVAAGTGAITPISLWVMAEGRYDTVNLPSFQIEPASLSWNWDTSSSNYAILKQAGFSATNNQGWLIQAGEPFSSYMLRGALNDLVLSDPVGSGYADEQGLGAAGALDKDMEALFAGIPEGSLWVTRLTAALSRAALVADLELGAASDQSIVQRSFEANQQTGTPPTCPDYPPCSPDAGAGDLGGTGGESGSGHSGGCGILSRKGGDSVPMLGGLVLMTALVRAHRRRRTA